MRFFEDIVGNEDLRRRVGEAVSAGRFPHAVIIEGQDGIGKNLMARQIAAALLCTGAEAAGTLPCGRCAFCRKTAENRMPDVVTVTREEKATIGVDPIRAIRSDMYLSATEAPRKIYIIDDAHTMTVQAQNALLKVLEEPPTEVNILLLCERSEALLSTIRSRAQILRMTPLSEEELERFADRQPALQVIRRGQPDVWQDLKLACGGCAGHLLALAGRGQAAALQKKRDLVFGIIDTAAARRGYAPLSDALKRLAPKRKELTEDLATLSLALRDLCLCECDENAPLLFYTDRTRAVETARALGRARLCAMFDAVSQAMGDLAGNANVGLVTASLAVSFLS